MRQSNAQFALLPSESLVLLYLDLCFVFFRFIPDLRGGHADLEGKRWPRRHAKARCAGTRRKAWQPQGHPGLRPPVVLCTTGFSSGGPLHPWKRIWPPLEKGWPALFHHQSTDCLSSRSFASGLHSKPFAASFLLPVAVSSGRRPIISHYEAKKGGSSPAFRSLKYWKIHFLLRVPSRVFAASF